MKLKYVISKRGRLLQRSATVSAPYSNTSSFKMIDPQDSGCDTSKS